jgi:hypothetical protein
MSTKRQPTHPAKEGLQSRVICLMYIVSKEPKSIQDSEADTTSSRLLSSSVDIQTLIHRHEPNRPHISSDTNFSKSVEAKPTGSAKLPSATRQSYLRYFLPHPAPEHPLLPGPRPNRASAPPVKGLLRLHPKSRNPLFRLSSCFFHRSGF